MIDTKELRRLAQAATINASLDVWLEFRDSLSNPTTIIKLLDRLEAAEKDVAHQKALAESALRVAERWERKCDSLRAKIAEMEQQEPVGWQRLYKDGSGSEDFTDLPDVFEHQRPLYALPGAKGE